MKEKRLSVVLKTGTAQVWYRVAQLVHDENHKLPTWFIRNKKDDALIVHLQSFVRMLSSDNVPMDQRPWSTMPLR